DSKPALAPLTDVRPAADLPLARGKTDDGDDGDHDDAGEARAAADDEEDDDHRAASRGAGDLPRALLLAESGKRPARTVELLRPLWRTLDGREGAELAAHLAVAARAAHRTALVREARARIARLAPAGDAAARVEIDERI